MEIQSLIKKAILDELNELREEHDLEVNVEESKVFGDYTTNIAMQAFKKLPTALQGAKGHTQPVRAANPKDLAEKIAQGILSKGHTFLSNVEVAGPGFINFTLSDRFISQQIREILEGNSIVKLNSGKRAIVEYSSPNIAKPFTVGHLRSTIIGDAVANLLEASGYTVFRDNHLGDWGTQFGKLIVAIKELGKGNQEANIDAISSAKQPVKELVALYVEFHEKAESDPALEERGREWFTKLEHGDDEAKKLWQMCIDWSWQEFHQIYQELGVSFTENGGHGYGESFFEDKMQRVVDELQRSGYLQEGKEGARLFFFPEEELPPLMVLKKDGSTLYATRDLATDKFRLEKYGQDILIINEVGAEQELYFKQLYRIEELLGWYTPGQRVHVKHGLFRFKDGKMSTRKGNVIWLEDVIAEAKKRAHELAADDTQHVSNLVAIGAIKWNDLKRAAHLDITFDWDELLSMDGNSGPYVQYALVRANSVLEKAGTSSFQHTPSDVTFDVAERALARQLVFFPEAVERAGKDYAPHTLCTYLYALAGVFNSFYNTTRILDDETTREKRLMLTKATSVILSKGLQLLGILVPEKM
jgi:arginyl-tRNA synthetase